MTRFPVLALALGLAPAAFAASKGGDAKGADVSILPGGNSKAPISIEADQLDYFEKESRAVYNGHVVVVQGDSRLTCSRLTIFMEKSAPAEKPAAAAAPAADAQGSPTSQASSQLKHMDCAGPVKVASKTQTATSDNGVYDKEHNNILLTGHVVLADGPTVTKGDKLIYDLASGKAEVFGGRVTGVFVPGSQESPGAAKKK